MNYHTGTKETSLPYYSLMAGRKRDGFVTFQERLCEMKSKQPCLGFEFGLPILFPVIITPHIRLDVCVLNISLFFQHSFNTYNCGCLKYQYITMYEMLEAFSV